MKNKPEQLSLHQQQYIETIYSLSLKENHAHSKDIAEELNIRMPSVTEALRTLSGMGLVNYQARQAVTLTEKGRDIGRELNKRHAVVAAFFTNILGVDAENAEKYACKVEHVIDDELRKRFSDFVKFLNEGINADAKKQLISFRENYKQQ
jgi:DtxR family transcriptional regulator, Mn-dependent transcriptional regulator